MEGNLKTHRGQNNLKSDEDLICTVFKTFERKLLERKKGK